MREGLEFARAKLGLAQASQIRNARRRVASLAVGDMVLLSTNGITLRGGTDNKLTSRFIGPFEVTAVVNPNAYRLALPPQLQAMHATFNIDKLKPYRETTNFSTRPKQLSRPPPVVDADSNGDAEYEVERITAQRYRGNRTQFLVRWKGYRIDEDT